MATQMQANLMLATWFRVVECFWPVSGCVSLSACQPVSLVLFVLQNLDWYHQTLNFDVLYCWTGKSLAVSIL